MNYKSNNVSNFQSIEQSWESRLRGLIDRITISGENGEDIANYSDKKREPNVVRTKRFMNDSVFKLGSDMQKRFGNISYKEWGHWMYGCALELKAGEVVIHHHHEFFIDEASKRFQKSLEKFYELPVKWNLSKNLNEHVFQYR